MEEYLGRSVDTAVPFSSSTMFLLQGKTSSSAFKTWTNQWDGIPETPSTTSLLLELSYKSAISIR
jgi:hypothetical protein